MGETATELAGRKELLGDKSDILSPTRGLGCGRRCLVLIPAYNEAGNIAQVIERVRKIDPTWDVLVVDDGSNDATGDIAEASGAFAVRLPYNLGIGGAIQTGYQFAERRKYDFVCRIDGDGQHDPADIVTLMVPVVAGQADVTIGSRYLEGDGETGTLGNTYVASRARLLGIKLFARLVSLLVRHRLTDTTSGFQVANAEAAAFLARHCPIDYPEVEMVALLTRSGFRVEERRVTMLHRHTGRSSITPLRSLYYMIKVVLALLIGQLRRPPTREVRASDSR